MPGNTPAGKLVSRFGKVDEMAALYAPDIEWSLPGSLPFPRPIVGRQEVIAFGRRVWGEVYRPDCEVKILDEIGDENSSAVRFIYRAFSLDMGKIYENEYTVFVRAGPEGIREVFEAFDTTATHDFFRGEPTQWRGFVD